MSNEAQEFFEKAKKGFEKMKEQGPDMVNAFSGMFGKIMVSVHGTKKAFSDSKMSIKCSKITMFLLSRKANRRFWPENNIFA